MNYSLESFYDVVKEDLLNHEFLFNEFRENDMDIMLSFMKNPPLESEENLKVHFKKVSFMMFSNTAYGEWVQILEGILTDYNHRRGFENLYFALGVSLYLMEDIVRILDAEQMAS